MGNSGESGNSDEFGNSGESSDSGDPGESGDSGDSGESGNFCEFGDSSESGESHNTPFDQTNFMFLAVISKMRFIKRTVMFSFLGHWQPPLPSQVVKAYLKLKGPF